MKEILFRRTVPRVESPPISGPLTLLEGLQKGGFSKKEALFVEKFVAATLLKTKIDHPESYAEVAMNRGVDRAVRILREGTGTDARR